MAKVITDNIHYTQIANALRQATGGNETYQPSQMAEAVREVRQAEVDRFWEIYQVGGARTDYSSAFSYGGTNVAYNGGVNNNPVSGWCDEIYNPKYPIRMVGPWKSNSMFYYSGVTDTKVDIICEGACGLGLTFAYSKLKYIRRLVVTPQTTYTNTFNNSYDLELLNIEGTIGENGFSVANAEKLTYESLMGIVNALESKTSGTWAVTLGSANLAKLTDAEKAIATQKGWTLA